MNMKKINIYLKKNTNRTNKLLSKR